MNKMRTGNLMLIAALFLTACMGAATPQKEQGLRQTSNTTKTAKTFVFECSDKFSYVARIEGDTAWLFLPQKTVNLHQVPSGSGVKFSDGQITHWTKGDEALLQTSAATYRNCMNNRAEAIWEHAKLNGVDFRAVGNEPGWYLEIRNTDKTLFVGNYGEFRVEFPTPDPYTIQEKRRTMYQSHVDGKKILVVIEERQCRDTMSGESFSVAVDVTIDQKTYRGCGRALH
jgi:uncharacterized membrane protein